MLWLNNMSLLFFFVHLSIGEHLGCFHVLAIINSVIALRQIIVTALFYLEDSRKIHLRGVRARRSKEMRRRAAQRAGERERAGSGSSIYMFLSPWACPV